MLELGTPARLVLALVLAMAGCAPVANTPAQERAWARWEACRQVVPLAQLARVDPDGRLRVEVASMFDRDRVLGCLRAAEGPDALPEASVILRPVGP